MSFTNGVYNNTNVYFGFRLSIKNTIYRIYTQHTILANMPKMCLALTWARIQSLQSTNTKLNHTLSHATVILMSSLLDMIWLFCIRWWDCVIGMFKQTYIGFTVLMAMVHCHNQMVQYFFAPSVASYGSKVTPESRTSPRILCLVAWFGHTGMSCVPLLRAGGNPLVSYYNHWDQYSIAMSVELYLATARQPVQIPGTVYLIPVICCSITVLYAGIRFVPVPSTLGVVINTVGFGKSWNMSWIYVWVLLPTVAYK